MRRTGYRHDRPGLGTDHEKASAIVTNRGGRTCHAAIIARELGIPAVVGCGDATDRIQENQNVTVSCAEGDTGYVYAELLDFSVKSSSVGDMPDLPLKVMMNVGNPDRAFDFACLPNEGVGLARLEFIINRMIGVHPRALLEFDDREPGLQNEIRELMKGYDSPREFYVGRLTEGSPPSAPLSIETGDRASVGLQIERIRQHGGRRAL